MYPRGGARGEALGEALPGLAALGRQRSESALGADARRGRHSAGATRSRQSVLGGLSRYAGVLGAGGASARGPAAQGAGEASGMIGGAVEPRQAVAMGGGRLAAARRLAREQVAEADLRAVSR